MNYSLNAGEWNSVFAVPTSVVDKYIKLAGAGSLKLLLFLLRNGGKIYSDNELKEALGFRRDGELEDAALFWVQRGVIRADNGSLSANAEISAQEVLEEVAEVTTATKSSTASARKLSDNAAAIYTPTDIAGRIQTDPAINGLFRVAEGLYGRMLRQPESRMILMLVDHYDLPPAVCSMLLTYCFRIGKTSTGYIETVAQTWSEDEIKTVEQADILLAKLEKRFSIEEQLRKSMEMKTKFSPKQLNFIKTWTEEWEFSADMILMAHELTLDNTGGMSFNYTNKILENWKAAGISTRAAAEQEMSERKTRGKGGQKTADNNSSIDVSGVMQDVLQKYRSEG
ncbi:MAG: DnaD domain protein [Oscillospiraceae bacterium]|nr:DnaD domain protein [Oscillospiraceae bacterium]